MRAEQVNPPPDPDFRLMILMMRSGGLSCWSLAKKIGVSYSTICNYVDNRGVKPNYHNGVKLVMEAIQNLEEDQLIACRVIQETPHIQAVG